LLVGIVAKPGKSGLQADIKLLLVPGQFTLWFDPRIAAAQFGVGGYQSQLFLPSQAIFARLIPSLFKDRHILIVIHHVRRKMISVCSVKCRVTRPRSCLTPVTRVEIVSFSKIFFPRLSLGRIRVILLRTAAADVNGNVSMTITVSSGAAAGANRVHLSGAGCAREDDGLRHKPGRESYDARPSRR
jgi:hypothetical protein